MPNLLNFSDWHMQDSDGSKATLVHKDGHTMHIAVKSLPKIQREQIKRMKMASGGRVKRYAEGTPDEPVSDEAGASASPTPATQITINAGPGAQNNPQAVDNQAPSAPAAPPPAPSSQAPAISPQYRGSAPAEAPAQKASAPLLDDKTLNVPAAVNLQQQAIGQQQAVDTKKAEAQAEYENAYLNQQKEIANRQQENFNELHSHTDEFRKYMMENPINPTAFQENRSTGQKISTAIGLLAGGFKQGYRGGNNPALDFLNAQIDRDIAAQRANADNRRTVWGAYHQLYGDANIATNLAKVSANDMLVHQASLMAAKLGTPQAAATATALKAQKDLENHDLLLNSAGRLGTIRTGPGAPPGGARATAGAPLQPSSEPSEYEQALKAESAGGAGATASPSAELPAIQPILHGGAQAMFNGLPYNPTAKPDYEQARSQFTSAQQADKALEALAPAFDTMKKNLSVSGRAEQQAQTLKDLPFGTGELLHGPAKFFANAQPENRTYASAQTQLLSDLTNALKGTNVSGEEIKKVVMDNSPVYGDGPKELKQKRDTIEGFIKRSVPSSLLSKFHLTN